MSYVVVVCVLTKHNISEKYLSQEILEENSNFIEKKRQSPSQEVHLGP